MKIAFYKASKGTWIDKVIAIWTFGRYSHCELIDDGGVAYSISGTQGGVYKRKFYDGTESDWDIVELPPIITCSNPDDLLYKFYEKTKTSKYDWFGMFFRFLIQINLPNKRYYCTEWCAEVLNLVLIYPHNDTRLNYFNLETGYSPSKFKKRCDLLLSEIF